MEKEDEKKVREENKEEIDKLWSVKLEGPVAFIKFVAEKYPDWKNKKVEISEEDLKEGKLKSSFTKVIFYYHPDRQAQDKDGIFSYKDILMREEITTILNTLNN